VSQPQFVEPSGSFPMARDSLGTLRPEFENLGTNWRDSVARSNVPPEFDRSQVANGPGDRAVDPVSSGECYQGHGQGGNRAAVERAVSFAPESHRERPETIVKYRQMDPAAVEAELLPRPRASHPSSMPMEVEYEVPCRLRQPMEVGCEVPCSLRQSCPPSEVHTYPPTRIDVPPRGALAPHPVIQGDQLEGQRVRAPSVAPGVPSSSSVPAAKQEGFIAEAQGTGPTVDADHVPPCLVDASAPSSEPPTQASGAFAELRDRSSSLRSTMGAPA